MAVVVFEDAYVGRLAPITNTRPAFDICCGGNRLIDLVSIVGQPVHAVVRTPLQTLVAARFPEIADAAPAAGQPHLLVNARLVPSPRALTHLQQGAAAANSWAIVEHGRLLAAKLTPTRPLEALCTVSTMDEWLGADVPRASNPDGQLALLEYPHEVVKHHVANAASGFELYAERNDIPQVADGVFVADKESFGPGVSTSSRQGPIVVDRGAKLGPGTVLIGPVLVGRNAIVREHSAIKNATMLGHTTRVGGEIIGSIFESYTNKQHFGYMGHSYVGSWVNLGAGTSNSDLKNSYGDVRMHYGSEKIETGMRLMGCVLGDFVRTAINTSIFTGKIVGSFSHLYGVVAENVGPFMNYAKQLGSVTELTPEVVTTMQKRMFERRGVEQLDCDRQILERLFAATAPSREGLTSGPPTFG